MKTAQNRKSDAISAECKTVDPHLPVAVLAMATKNKFSAGSFLHYQDEPVSHITLVLSGHALAISYDRQGKETWVSTYRSGEFIGTENLYSNQASSCNVVAKSDAVVLQFSKTCFLKLMAAHPQLTHYVMRDLAAKVNRFAASKLENRNLSMRGLIAAEIKRLARPVSSKQDIYVVSPAPKITELASRLGVARETVSRNVSYLVKNNIVERRARAFFVPDLALLEAQMR